MAVPALVLLCIGPESPQVRNPLDGSAFGPFAVHRVDDLNHAIEWLGHTRADALLLHLDKTQAQEALNSRAFAQATSDAALLVSLTESAPEITIKLLRLGVQDVLLSDDLQHASWPARLRAAVERQGLLLEARKAYATDLGTGLPNRQQLIEHMSQLLALREREPRPVSVLVFRIDGLQAVEAAHGHESANVVRRKVAVRLRAGVRASDVVASMGGDVFAVLLPSTESPDDALHVADKLARSVRDPFKVAGMDMRITAHAGVAQFPQHGKQPDELLRHAWAIALSQSYGTHGAAND
jgi:diguanylate cyclase (GGDEF)-like protein